MMLEICMKLLPEELNEGVKNTWDMKLLRYMHSNKAKMLEIEINEIPTKSTTYSAWRAVCIEFILISTF